MNRPGFTAGTSSIILIFLVLCLTVFSVLSLSSAIADDRLSAKTAERTTAYYHADSTANKQLAVLDELLQEQYQKTDSEQTYYKAIISHIEQADGILVTADDSGIPMISWDTTLTDKQVLSCSISTPYPASSADGFYQITCWKVINTSDWTPDTTQNLYRKD